VVEKAKFISPKQSRVKFSYGRMKEQQENPCPCMHKEKIKPLGAYQRSKRACHTQKGPKSIGREITTRLWPTSDNINIFWTSKYR
jgi:hypothetical protein